MRLQIVFFAHLCLLTSTIWKLVQADNGEQWVTQDEFQNRLPVTLSPIKSYTAQTSGECFVYCKMNNCSSVGYSVTYQSCQLFSHPTLAKPLPTLAVDPTVFQHRMYYRNKFCPAGWESDPVAGKCYYMNTLAQDRTTAWQVCEEHLNSEMVTFQTPWQRDNLYQILSSNYASTTKWWTGYALFDSMLWPRPIDDVPGYRTYRGDCPNNDIVDFLIRSPAECALRCDRSYRDKCVGFIFNANAGRCYLKYKMCNVNSNTQGLGTEFWSYHKIHGNRPMTQTINGDLTSGVNIANFVDVSLHQCKQIAANYLNTVHFAYMANNRQCWLHSTTSPTKGSCTNCVSFDVKDIADGWCPFGLRYRDVCLVYMNSATNTWDNMQNWCRSQGGKFTRPVDGYRKMSIFYALNAQAFVDWTEVNHLGNWTTQLDGLTFNDSFYNRWMWSSGQPDNAQGLEHCGASFGRISSSTGNYVPLNDCNCASGKYAICEFPITQSFPKDCRFTPTGQEYSGRQAMTASGAQCQQWSGTAYNGAWRRFPDWYTTMAYCRNPDNAVFNQPWCYRQDNGSAEICNIPMCPESDWAPSQTYNQPEQPYAAITQTNTQTDNYYWTIESISTQANALCQIDMNDWCPYYFRGSCYQLYKIPNNHSEAQTICSQNGWHLASVTTKDEQMFLMGITQRLGNQWIVLNGYHIGLYWSTTANNWAWENGEPFSVTTWQSGQPSSTGSGYCGYIFASVSAGGQGWWATTQCWFKQWFICEIEIAG